MSDALQPLLDDLRAALQTLYGDRLVKLVLYGSYARGEARDESDVDVLAVLKGAVQPVQEIRRMGAACLKLSLRYGRHLSVLPVSLEEFNAKDSMLLRNVREEGIAV